MNAWCLLAASILLEVCGTTCMKLSAGFSRFWPSLLIFVFYGLSFAAFTFALKRLDLSLSYPIWAGAGTVLITLSGWLLFHESLDWFKLASIGLIVAGVAGLTSR